MKKFLGFLRLARPANIVTAFSDIGAGVCIAYYSQSSQFAFERMTTDVAVCYFPKPWQECFVSALILFFSTLGLYGGGVVMNDVADAALDAVERPERPIPSGLIKRPEAAAWGIALLLFGIACATVVHWPDMFSSSLFLAFGIAAAALLYDFWGKHQTFLGPVNMGLCRGLNLLLGMSIIQQAIAQWWWLALVPIVFIAAITAISRGEVYGGKKSTLNLAALFYAIVITAILVVSFFNSTYLTTAPFLLLFGVLVFRPLITALKNPIGPNIGKAVKAGVLSLIVMNAAWAAAFGAPMIALAMLLLLPLSMWLAKAFAVT